MLGEGPREEGGEEEQSSDRQEEDRSWSRSCLQAAGKSPLVAGRREAGAQTWCWLWSCFQVARKSRLLGTDFCFVLLQEFHDSSMIPEIDSTHLTMHYLKCFFPRG